MKEPVKRQRAMFVKDAQKPEAKRMNAVAGIGGGNSTKPVEVRKPLSKPRVSLDKVREPSDDGMVTGTKPEWPARVKALGLSLAEFGRLTGTPYQTLKDQASGKARTPGMLLTVLLLLEGDHVNIWRIRERADKDSA